MILNLDIPGEEQIVFDATTTACKRLYVAVMASAISDLKQTYKNEQWHKFKQLARDFFLLQQDTTVTFKDCCRALNLKPRDVLVALEKQGLLKL